MICQKCEYRNEDDSKFCVNCGAALTEISEDNSEKEEKLVEEDQSLEEKTDKEYQLQIEVQSEAQDLSENQAGDFHGIPREVYQQPYQQVSNPGGIPNQQESNSQKVVLNQQEYNPQGVYNQQGYNPQGMYNQQGYNPQNIYANYQKPATRGMGLGIASMVLGIISLPFCTFLIPAILALIFGIISKVQGYKRGMSTAGIVLGSVSLGLFVIYFLLFFMIGFTGATSEFFYY